jgi:hypothetical protein
MGYLHIENLYRPTAQIILLFKECYAMEKVHGTSAHISWKNNQVTFFSGGESPTNFRSLFDEQALFNDFTILGHPDVTIYGEAYGGKQQGMRHTYGDKLCFIVFDIKIGDIWLTVPNMADVAAKFGLEVVPWLKVSTDLASLDLERDRPSEVAIRRGIAVPKAREGVVLRPLAEFIASNGSRVIAKHKCSEFSETKTPRPIVDPSKLSILNDAQSIADEWVTPMRLEHILQKLPSDVGMEATPKVINAMIEDVFREAKGEIIESKEAKAAIGKVTAKLFKAHVSKITQFS